MALCCCHPELTDPLWELSCVKQECQHAGEYSLLTPPQAKPQTLHHSSLTYRLTVLQDRSLQVLEAAQQGYKAVNSV